jgi:hypothetical protein
MKTKPVRVCDVSRVLRISSASLISFLEEKGYSVIGDFRSPLSSKMVELIQNGYRDGPPFQELNPFMPQAEEWEKLNEDTFKRLHTPPPRPVHPEVPEEEVTIRKTRTRKPRLKISSHSSTVYTGRIDLTPIDLELIHQILELDESNKTKVRDFLRRKTILKALSHLD